MGSDDTKGWVLVRVREPEDLWRFADEWPWVGQQSIQGIPVAVIGQGSPPPGYAPEALPLVDFCGQPGHANGRVRGRPKPAAGRDPVCAWKGDDFAPAAAAYAAVCRRSLSLAAGLDDLEEFASRRPRSLTLFSSPGRLDAGLLGRLNEMLGPAGYCIPWGVMSGPSVADVTWLAARSVASRWPPKLRAKVVMTEAHGVARSACRGVEVIAGLDGDNYLARLEALSEEELDVLSIIAHGREYCVALHRPGKLDAALCTGLGGPGRDGPYECAPGTHCYADRLGRIHVDRMNVRILVLGSCGCFRIGGGLMSPESHLATRFVAGRGVAFISTTKVTCPHPYSALAASTLIGDGFSLGEVCLLLNAQAMANGDSPDQYLVLGDPALRPATRVVPKASVRRTDDGGLKLKMPGRSLGTGWCGQCAAVSGPAARMLAGSKPFWLSVSTGAPHVGYIILPDHSRSQVVVCLYRLPGGARQADSRRNGTQTVSVTSSNPLPLKLRGRMVRVLRRATADAGRGLLPELEGIDEFRANMGLVEVAAGAAAWDTSSYAEAGRLAAALQDLADAWDQACLEHLLAACNQGAWLTHTYSSYYGFARRYPPVTCPVCGTPGTDRRAYRHPFDPALVRHAVYCPVCFIVSDQSAGLNLHAKLHASTTVALGQNLRVCLELSTDGRLAAGWAGVALDYSDQRGARRVHISPEGPCVMEFSLSTAAVVPTVHYLRAVVVSDLQVLWLSRPVLIVGTQADTSRGGKA